MGNLEKSSTDFPFLDFILLAAIVVGIILLIRYAKPVIVPAASIATTAAAFSPWFPVR